MWLSPSVDKRQLILGYALHPEMRDAKPGLRDLSGIAELERTFLPEGHSHIRTTGGEAGFYSTLFGCGSAVLCFCVRCVSVLRLRLDHREGIFPTESHSDTEFRVEVFKIKSAFIRVLIPTTFDKLKFVGHTDQSSI